MAVISSAVVIGAGPAGCAAASHLARAGVMVTVVEGKPFPRAKVCGEFVSPAATGLLEEIAGPDALRRAGARVVERFVLEVDTRERSWPLPAPCWALSRRSLDRLLLERAREAGTAVMQPVRADRVEYGEESVRILLRRGDRVESTGPDPRRRGGEPDALEADIVIHADGSGRLDPAGPVPCGTGMLGHKCHLRLGPGERLGGVRIRTAPGAYLGTISVEGDLATCALAARREVARGFGGDLDAMVRSLWPGFNPAQREGPWLSCGVQRSGYVRPGHARSFRIGNAAAAVDPIGGEGIGLALWSGRELARLLTDAATLAELSPAAAPSGWRPGRSRHRSTRAERAVAQSERLGLAQRRMAILYRARLRTRLPACRAAAAALVRPRLVRAAWPLLSSPGFSMAPWYALTGKRGGAVAQTTAV